MIARIGLGLILVVSGGCSPPAESTPGGAADAVPALTADRAKEAILERMRSEDFFGFKPDDWAREDLRARDEGWYEFGGAFRINPSKRIYTVVLRPPPEVKACTFTFEGAFELKNGKWVAGEAKEVSSALGGGVSNQGCLSCQSSSN